MDIKEIINSWIISSNPNEEQKNQANQRGSICEVCPSKKVISRFFKISTVCGECGCPISKKIFSPQHNPCPLKKWEDIDKKYLKVEKKTKTLF
jgi:hypothetical protein